MGAHALKRFLLLVALSAALLPGPTAAAPPVGTASGQISTTGFDGAAFQAGMREWGIAGDCSRSAHVMARLDGDRLRLLIGVPSSTSHERAVRWLGELADELGWSRATLALNPQPGGLYLRADVDDVVRGTFLGSSEARLPLDRVLARLPELTPMPAVAGIRLTGSHLISASPPPEYRFRVIPDDYLFYLPQVNPALAAGPLTVRYGIPPRWIAAAAAGFLIWLLFPVIALFGARYYLAGQEGVAPMQRLVMFRRWQRAVTWIPAVVAFAGVFLIRGSFFMFFGRFLPMLIPLAVMLPLFGVGLVGRLIGLPLERAAWPDREPLPWYRAAQSELWVTAIIGMMMIVVGVTSFSAAGGGLRLPFGRVGLDSRSVIAVPLVFAAGAIAWGAILNFRRKRGTLRSEPDAPEPLTAAVRELTHRLDCPINQLRVGKRRDGLLAGTVVVLNDIAVVGAEIPELMEPDQVAALVAAAALTLPRTRVDKWITGGLTALIILPTLAIFASLLWMPVTRAGSFPLYLLAQPFIFIGSIVAARRTQNRQQQADLRAAEALDDPLRFLQALRKLEEAQLATSGTDPSAAARRLPMTQRRLRLERKLGVE